MRHRITKTALQDLLSLLNIVIPGCISKTKYFIQRYFLKGSSEFVSHYYCPECETYLGKENTATNLETIFFCPSCKQNVSLDQCSSKGKYFLSSPIEDQLIYFMENTNLFDRIKAKKEKNVDLNVKGEIYTGECYRGEKVQSFLRESPYNFTMSYGSDGIHVYESSPYSVWPVFCTINELDFYEKSYFLSMSTLWHGDSKPQQNTFLQPFVEEAQHLYDHGFQWKDSNGILRRSKVMFLLCTADAPARAMLTNMTQFNGEYGCGICLNPGIRIRKGRGTAQVYDNVQCPLRDNASILEQAARAVETGYPALGVKGPSQISLIPKMDLSNRFAPDYMHCVLLGIVKQFITMWKTNYASIYYVQNFEERIDQVLLNVCPTDEILRSYRPMAKYGKDWKASEFRNFLLFYSPVALFHLLPKAYFKHWMLLVKSFWILLSKSVTNDDIEIVKLLINQFVSETKHLYGLKNMSYNLHLLTHVPDFVRDWGCPWAYSAFIFENAGGVVKQLFHGSKHISKQMFQNFVARQKIRVFSMKYIPNGSDLVNLLYNRLDSPIRSTSSNLPVEQLVGQEEKMEKVSVRILLAIGIFVTCELNQTCFKFSSYQKIKLDGRTYTTAMYCEMLKRNNSVVQLISGEMFRILNIITVQRECVCQGTEEGMRSVSFQLINCFRTAIYL